MEDKPKQTASRQRKLQDEVQEKEQQAASQEESKAMQAGARPYPVPPFPKQHQSKPGDEGKVDPAPLYDAPYYIGAKKLEGKVAIITGGDSGIGRAVAVMFAREGADIVICHLNELADAKITRMLFGLEADQIVGAEILDQLAAHRYRFHHRRRHERNMQEEAHGGASLISKGEKIGKWKKKISEKTIKKA